MSQTLGRYGASIASYEDVYTDDLPVNSPEVALPTTSDDMPWLTTVRRRMNEIRRLKYNWDGRGSARVPAETLAFAFSMLTSIMPPRAPVPAIVPLGDGGLQLVWYSPRCDIEVEIAKPNQVNIYQYCHLAGTEREWDESTDFTRLSDILWSISKLVTLAQQGKSVTISIHGKPVAKLMTIEPQPVMGLMKEKWPRVPWSSFAAMSDEEAAEWGL
jgi:antitoxin (DNA-binding transcriptional repressor) of toxin-antitoxin stability system